MNKLPFFDRNLTNKYQSCVDKCNKDENPTNIDVDE